MKKKHNKIGQIFSNAVSHVLVLLQKIYKLFHIDWIVSAAVHSFLICEPWNGRHLISASDVTNIPPSFSSSYFSSSSSFSLPPSSPTLSSYSSSCFLLPLILLSLLLHIIPHSSSILSPTSSFASRSPSLKMLPPPNVALSLQKVTDTGSLSLLTFPHCAFSSVSLEHLDWALKRDY